MKKTTRRDFLTNATLAASLPFISLTPSSGKVSLVNRSNWKTGPLAGIERENVKITDVKVILLSFKLPKDQQ